MSECVVRMEMPKSCKNCHFRFHMYCGLAKKDIFPEYILLENRPYWCPIICQLPEGHGRLVDMRDIEQMEVSALDKQDKYFVGWNDAIKICQTASTIVPAERSKT